MKEEVISYSYGRKGTVISSGTKGYSYLSMEAPSRAPSLRIDILLYMGSFDPPHLGHAAVIKHALKIVQPNELQCVVLNRHCENKDLSPAVHRIEMLRRFTRAIGGNVTVNTVDVEEDLSGCTAETVAVLRKRHPEKSFGILLGTDHLATFPTWKSVDTLTRNAVCFFVPRPGTAWSNDHLIPGVVVLSPLQEEMHAELSSLKIKKFLHEKNEEKIRKMTFPGVAKYLLEQRLYCDFFERHPQLLAAC